MVAVGVMMTDNGLEEDTAGGPGTAQDGEALALITYVRALRDKEGVYWIVVDSEAAMGALWSYLKGDRSGEGMKLLYAQVIGDEGRHRSNQYSSGTVPLDNKGEYGSG